MAKLIKIGKKYYSDLRIGGKRIRRALSSDKRFAEEKLAELVKWRGIQKEGCRDGDMSWSLFCEKYEESIAWKKYNSIVHDKLALRYLGETFPLHKLSQVTPELLGRARNRWLGPHGGANHINRLVMAVKAAMHWAEAHHLIHKQNWEVVKEIKTTKARKYFWTLKEMAGIIKTLREPYRTVLFLGGMAGLRPAESQNLTWDDLDFNLGRLNINPKEDWQPKDYEKRTIKMPPQLIAHLKSLPRGSAYVLGPDRMHPQVLSHMVSRLLKAHGYKGTSYTARHTYASHLVMAGVPIYTVSKLLGHSSVETTEDHYAHLSASHMDQEVAKMPMLALK